MTRLPWFDELTMTGFSCYNINPMQKSCTKCGSSYEVTDDDLAFYEKVSPIINEERNPFPAPNFCVNCRLQRKICFRNERTFYNRKCDATGKDILAIYAPDKDVAVYDTEYYWSDNWDSRDFGRDYDFNRPFFDQVADLWKATPLINLWCFNCENADFNNCCFSLKNSYMNYCSDESERIIYCYVAEFCNDCTDCNFLHKSELCYECNDCTNAYNCTYSSLLDNCNDCFFSSDLIGCKQCFGCHGLRQQTYCIYNKPVSQEEWNEFMSSVEYAPQSIESFKTKSEEIRLSVPHVFSKQVQCDNCTGNFLYKSKDVQNGFDVHESEHCKNIIYAPWDTKYVQDAYAFGGIELGYEILAGGVAGHHVAFVNGMMNGLSDCFYCSMIGQSSEHLFGCVSSMKKQYCILNKQYSKEEYFEMLPKIIEHMRNTGEYGEFFPASMSLFDYNETIATDMIPLSREEALSQGFRWRDIPPEPPQADKVIPADRLPDKIDGVPDDILNWAIICPVSGKQFKIVAQELKFYRRMKLPIPHLHPEERYQRRMRRRPPRNLWSRKCMKCEKEIQSAYSPERPEKVYCEDCYLKEVY